MRGFLIFLIGALLGAVAGAALIFYFFGSAPQAVKPAPGALIKPPDANGQPPGTAVVVLDQDFFNIILETVFRDINAPTFPLNLSGQNQNSQTTSFALQAAGNCQSQIVLKQTGSDVTTGVRFDNNQVTAPLAFSGNANVLGSCIEFTGWAESSLELRYDAATQTVYGQINVQTINLDGVSPLASPFVTPLVQSSLNNRVNPIQILKGEQIQLKLPIQAANGTLNASVKDVRSEIKDNALRLYLTYGFTGTRNN